MRDVDAVRWFVLGRTTEDGFTHTSSLRVGLIEARGHTHRDTLSGSLFEGPSQATPSWSGALVYLILLEQIGKTLVPIPRDEGERGSGDLREALRLFTTTTPRQRDALYALRNAFAHDFSLTSHGRNKPERRHRFHLDRAPGPLVVLPSRRWNGHFGAQARGGPTRVSLRALGDTVEEIVRDLERQAMHGGLRIRRTMSPEELYHRFSFAFVDPLVDVHSAVSGAGPPPDIPWLRRRR